MTARSHQPFPADLPGTPEIENIRSTLVSIYPELRRIARNLLRRERSLHTLQPTALANEVVLRLLLRESEGTDPRTLLFMGIREMRTVLIDSGRRFQLRRKIVGLQPACEIAAPTPLEEVAHLNRVLDRLAVIDQRAAQVVELRFFAGMSVRETAAILAVSDRTVSDDWEFARCWLAARWGDED